MTHQPICILTIDVEDWFHLIGAGLDYQFRVPPGGIDVWDELPCRVVDNARWMTHCRHWLFCLMV